MVYTLVGRQFEWVSIRFNGTSQFFQNKRNKNIFCLKQRWSTTESKLLLSWIKDSNKGCDLCQSVTFSYSGLLLSQCHRGWLVHFLLECPSFEQHLFSIIRANDLCSTLTFVRMLLLDNVCLNRLGCVLLPQVFERCSNK